MATSLWQLLEKYTVVIPLIQRDYAQGRQTDKVSFIREKFLNALCSALKGDKVALELDFVYGYTKENKIESSFVPLDGQQRLTTLFLLHWFIAVKENKIKEAEKLLSKFTYETRHSSRVFCEKLVNFKPDDLDSPIKDTIINQPWFFTAWKNDPTIASMLIMLNAIQEKFQDIEDVWFILTGDQPRIVFHLLPMEKLGLPDDLYIKMNSRGKELTEFEHFKSRFSEILSDEQALIFNANIDQTWSDLFWNLYKGVENIDIAKIVDNAFLRFFRYVTDLLIAQHNIDVESHTDDFSIYQQIYSSDQSVDFLFSCLNIFSSSYSTNPGFFDSVFYTDEADFNVAKTRLFFQNATTDLFKKCADNYDATLRTNLFSIGEQILLYACIIHLINKTKDFDSRLRKLRNLITNSEDTVRQGNMQFLLTTASEIILNNRIDMDSKFNKTQAKEEEDKQRFIEEKSTLRETIYRLEDHHLLQGSVAIFKLEDDVNKYATAFRKVFTSTCQYETISRALLTFGDYSQKHDQRRRLGNHKHSVWRELLTPSQRRGDFHQTRDALYALLAHRVQNPLSTLETIIDDYLASFEEAGKPMDWKFYYIKYPSFRKWGTNYTEGFYYWKELDRTKPNEIIMMFKTQFNGRHWSPFLLTLKKLNTALQLEDYGAPLILVKNNSSLRIFNINQGFKFEASDEDSEKFLENLRQSGALDLDNIFKIAQNQNGVDIEDRIEKCRELILKV